MKKLFVILFFVMFSLSTVSASYPCKDTDGGKVYDVSGFAFRIGDPQHDRCIDGSMTDTLREAFCNSNIPSYEDISCSEKFGPNSLCVAGACKEFVWCSFSKNLDPKYACSSLKDGLVKECSSSLHVGNCVRVSRELCTRLGGRSYGSRESCVREVPEFSGLAAGLAFVGAAAGFFILRRRK